MTSRKILFFDIDGTLITEDRKIPEDAKRALAEAKKQGHLLFINTGRVYCNIEDFIYEGFDGMVMGCGTHIIYHGKELLHKRLTKAKCTEIAYKCREYGIQALFEFSEYSGFDGEMTDRNWLDDLVGYFRSVGRRMLESIDEPDFIFDKFSAYYDENSDLEAFKEYITKDFTYIDREGNFCEMEPIGFSKASGIQFLLEYFDIEKENAFVFGDSNNDIEMMQYVPNSIAMGNGSAECKKVASFITKDIDDGGLSYAMKHFELI